MRDTEPQRVNNAAAGSFGPSPPAPLEEGGRQARPCEGNEIEKLKGGFREGGGGSKWSLLAQAAEQRGLGGSFSEKEKQVLQEEPRQEKWGGAAKCILERVYFDTRSA